MVSPCISRALGWKFGEIPSWKGLQLFWAVLESPSLRAFKNIGMWPLGTWVALAVLVGIDGSEGFSNLSDSLILWFCVRRKMPKKCQGSSQG